MAVAVVATLLKPEIGDWGLIVLGVVIGTAVGIPAARNVKMTAMPQMVALFNGVGGGAVALVAWAEFRYAGGDIPLEEMIPILFSAIVGSVSFWGSNIAFGKLQEIIPGRPIMLPGQTILNALLLLVAVGCAVAIAAGEESEAPLHRDPRLGGDPRQHGRAADRRRGHAGRDLDAERLHGPVGRRSGHGARQHRADRGRDARRSVGLDPHEPDGEGDEPLDRRTS